MVIPLPLHCSSTPGLFVTGTDTGVGKTVVSCLIADQCRRFMAHASPRSRMGVLKPFASGCRRDREGLVSEDAEQLAHAADFDSDIGGLDLISPYRFREPLSPAAAIEIERKGEPLDWSLLNRSLRRLDEYCDLIVVEGVGGLLAPLVQESRHARPVTVLDLARAIGFPVIVVCRAGLGTLNHTAMTCELLRRAGLPIAGLILNGYEPDSPDISQQSNRDWLERQNGTRILATLPGRLMGADIAPRPGGAAWDVRAIPNELREAIDVTHFASLARPARATTES